MKLQKSGTWYRGYADGNLYMAGYLYPSTKDYSPVKVRHHSLLKHIHRIFRIIYIFQIMKCKQAKRTVILKEIISEYFCIDVHVQA